MKKVIICKLLMVIIPAIIAVKFPFIQNFGITSFDCRGKYIRITGTMDVLLTEQAWTEFGYREGNFYWFNEWWQNQVGSRFGSYRLVSITWTLLEHTETRDKLRFEIVLRFHADRAGRMDFDYCFRKIGRP